MILKRGPLAAIAALLIVTSSTAFAHTQSHVGDIVDATGEADLRPWEETVPASLDIAAAWIDASNADDLVFHIQLLDLAPLVDAKGWRYYLFTIHQEGGTCSNFGMDIGFLAVISPAGPGIPTHSWWSGCFSRTPESSPTGYLRQNLNSLPPGSWQAGPSGNEVRIVAPRDIALTPLPVGATVTDLQVQTWSWTNTLNDHNLGTSPGPIISLAGIVVYPPLPVADQTSVYPGPFQL